MVAGRPEGAVRRHSEVDHHRTGRILGDLVIGLRTHVLDDPIHGDD
jgi:hypothetical protein